jgi:DNA helicase-2/ATP-dependent DNA helicase PcrA
VQRILDVANEVTAGADRAYPKRLWSDRGPGAAPTLETCLDEVEQADAVCRSVLAHREAGVPLVRQAVLFRAAHHSDLLEVELARRNIPFVKYGGLRFVEAAHVKDVLSMLRLLENDRDEVAWFRVLQLLDGVGPAAARSAIAALGVAAPAGDADVGSPLRRFVEDPPALPASATQEAETLRQAFADVLDSDLPVAAEMERLRRAYEPLLRRIRPNAEARLGDLEQLARLASGATSRERFLTDLTLDPPVSTGELAGPPLLDEDFLVLSTMHSAKGCEWDAVHVIHAADGNIPSDLATGNREEVEEERRLFYVALTRARDTLHVYVPLRYYHRKHERGDGHSYAQVTRFLPPPVRALFEETGTTPDDGSPRGPGFGAERDPVGVTAVDAFLDGLWGSDP